MADTNNQFAIYSRYLHSERFTTQEDAEAHARTILETTPAQPVTVVKLLSTFTASVTVSEA